MRGLSQGLTQVAFWRFPGCFLEYSWLLFRSFLEAFWKRIGSFRESFRKASKKLPKRCQETSNSLPTNLQYATRWNRIWWSLFGSFLEALNYDYFLNIRWYMWYYLFIYNIPLDFIFYLYSLNIHVTYFIYFHISMNYKWTDHFL